jgi:hypothetical protein
MTPDKKIEQILVRLNTTIDAADVAIEKFSENLARNPAYAFEWGDAAVRAAGAKQVFARALRVFEEIAKFPLDTAKAEALADYRTETLRDVLRGAASSSRSTSSLSNDVERATLAAYAELLGILEDYS